MRICSKHFKEQDFFFRNHINKRCRLKKGVIPSENLPIRKHDTKPNEKLVVDRCRRAELRAELRQQNATTSNRSKNQVENIESENILNNIENHDIGNYDENTMTAAENLVLFSEGEKTRTYKKLFEDKGVQVNTYEEFKG
ncbi:hypothetical protein RN001_003096 [Aquatica leii]|uniref:THAP-type domain-containing protein n=1 Tax=Aquatica leii TaxID=1421715 RepID=A0AAN7PEG6_9COLE|nr:hypothetical protein RN001_003096 [Aquatica leii]